MASEEMDRLIAHLKRLGLAHAARNLDEHLQQAAHLKLSGTSGSSPASPRPKCSPAPRRAADLRITQAEFPEVCRLEDFDFKKQPALNRKPGARTRRACLRRQEAAGPLDRPLRRGKMHLAIALGVRACQAGYRVRFFRAYNLLTRLYASLADDTLELVLEQLCKPDLIIVDELGNSPRKREHDFAGVFFELVARRHRRGAVVLTTNLGFDQWPDALGSPSQVTPALDRLLEGAHVITFPKDAPSYRATRAEPPTPLPPSKRSRRTRPVAPGGHR